MSEILKAAEELVESVTYDECGIMGRGGNGGLISRETMRKTDELRLAIMRAKQRGAA